MTGFAVERFVSLDSKEACDSSMPALMAARLRSMNPPWLSGLEFGGRLTT